MWDLGVGAREAAERRRVAVDQEVMLQLQREGKVYFAWVFAGEWRVEWREILG